MILMLDNYDSFTYNVVQYLMELGADLQVYRNDAITVADIRQKRPAKIVLSPGPGRPEHAGIMNDLIKELSPTIPMLGICLGHQAIGQVYGARIGYAPTLMHGKTSDIHHDSSSLFRKVSSPFVATRYHSLVIEPASLPSDFVTTAWTADHVIMAIQHKRFPLFGVQFHPESILTTEGKKILRNFLEIKK